MSLQGIASSTDTAKVILKTECSPREAFLIGTSSNIEPLGKNDCEKIAELFNINPTKVPVGAYTTKRCFKPHIGYDGTVFHSGDTAIVFINEKETVVHLQGFLSVFIKGDLYSLLGSGICYLPHITDTGQEDTNYWSGFTNVKKQPSTFSVFFSVESIGRKVILYPCEGNLLSVVDYMRGPSSTNSEVIVPLYPEQGDMVLIQGESTVDIWHGHIQSVDYVNKTVDVFFFVQRNHSTHTYVREVRGRGARNKVSWDSIIGIAEGQWLGSSWLKKTQQQ